MTRVAWILLAALPLLALASLEVGASGVGLSTLWATPDPGLAAILWEVRGPRTLLALLLGAGLGLAGAALQGLLRNPLADPGLLGVTGAGSLAAIGAILAGLGGTLAVPLAGLVGSLVGVAALAALAGRADTPTLVLAGAALASLTAALTALALNLAPSPYAVYEVATWLLGSLADRAPDDLALAAPFALAGLGLLLTLGRALDALSLGEEGAASLGIDVARTRWLSVVGTALAVGAPTAVVGGVGFVGLIVPHLLRPFVGGRPGALLLPSALGGAALVLAADLLVRLVPVTLELRLGVVTALLGAPLFFALAMGRGPTGRPRGAGRDEVRRGDVPAAEPGPAPPLLPRRLAIAGVTRRREGVGPLTLAVEPGEVLGIVGPNGAGKSTLLRLLAGLLPADAGAVTLDGAQLPPHEARARHVAVLTQDEPLPGALTVAELVGLGRAPFRPWWRGPDPADVAAIARALAAAHLIGMAHRHLATLSGGEAARARAARVLAGEAAVLLLDEPTAGLDPAQRFALLDLLRGAAARGASVALVLHDLDLAAARCDRLALMAGGQLLAVGPPNAVLTAPRLREAFGVVPAPGTVLRPG